MLFLLLKNAKHSSYSSVILLHTAKVTHTKKIKLSSLKANMRNIGSPFKLCMLQLPIVKCYFDYCNRMEQYLTQFAGLILCNFSTGCDKMGNYTPQNN